MKQTKPLWIAVAICLACRAWAVGDEPADIGARQNAAPLRIEFVTAKGNTLRIVESAPAVRVAARQVTSPFEREPDPADPPRSQNSAPCVPLPPTRVDDRLAPEVRLPTPYPAAQAPGDLISPSDATGRRVDAWTSAPPVAASPTCGCNAPRCNASPRGNRGCCCGACPDCCGAPLRLFSPFGFDDSWTLTGWVNGGVTVNSRSADDHGPLGFNDFDDVMLNQAYAVLQRQATRGPGLDIGARLDLLFGADYVFTETSGLERRPNGGPHWNRGEYGVAMPQAYLEFTYDNLSMKLGHFYSLLGYESAMAPQNFFYSHSYSRLYAQPFTHTGMLLSYDYSPNLTLHGGLVNGWDRLDGVSDHVGFLGGVNLRSDDDVFGLSFAISANDEPTAVVGQTSGRTAYNVVFRAQLTNEVQYVADLNHGWQSGLAPGGQSAEWYGISQYLFCQLTDAWKVGARFESFRDDDGVRVTGVRAGNPYGGGSPGTFHAIALGFNGAPHSNVQVRPEVRWDWYDGVGVLPFDNNSQASQFTAGVDFIVLW